MDKNISRDAIRYATDQLVQRNKKDMVTVHLDETIAGRHDVTIHQGDSVIVLHLLGGGSSTLARNLITLMESACFNVEIGEDL